MELRPAGLVLLGMLVSCGPQTLEPDGGPSRPSLQELIHRSDAILTGTISGWKNVSKRAGDECSNLVRVTISVENVLLQDAPPGARLRRQLDAYFYSPRCGSSDFIEPPRRGLRSIYFLRNDHGRWRTLADYWGSIPVYSGRHTDEAGAGKSIEWRIAEILLTPGEGYSPRDFALDGEPSDDARALIGAGPANQLISSLLDHPDMLVRVAACVALAKEDQSPSCAGPVLSAYLDRFEKGDFRGISRALVMRLRSLEGYAEPSVRSRAPYLLYEASGAAGLR